jgi:predicted helicase
MRQHGGASVRDGFYFVIPDLIPGSSFYQPFTFRAPPAKVRLLGWGERVSRQQINAYRRTLAEQHRVTGSLNERVIRKAFAELLESTGRSHDLVFTNEWEGRGPRGNNISVDGALVPSILRKPFGYWEAKDSKDDLDKEITAKIAAGYPDDNIIYENSVIAILRQDGREVDRAPLQGDDDALLALLNNFYAYERPELTEFKQASAKFRADLPQILEALRMAIGEAEARSSDFARALTDFLKHAREAINPAVSADDVREMLIQHILTEEIFASVFDNPQYHRENNVARRLGELEAKFFTGALRHATTELLKPYYGAIKHAASGLADRREKQTFVKKLYEDFYKVYNPDAADRLGVVYTPGEIVRFMIRGAEWLTSRHFDKLLSDKEVEILDPATGTGTFIIELLEHMEGAGKEQLRYKYTQELHANEIAILPYYVANLNIEATYAALEQQYAEFPGLVFVDTLDNTAGLGIYKGSHYGDLLGSFADENLERVKRQNAAKISVIIGNPPYNAWQSDFNARNPNRPYRRVDERIRQTYARRSTSTNKISLSDMYVRFWRWASDRLRDDGVIAFVTNRSFIEKIAFDGFRLSIAEEFAECWLMDLGGDVRANPKLSGTKHNAMGIQTGLTIAFMVRKQAAKGFKLFYARRPEDEIARDKLSYLDSVQFDRWDVAPLKPDPKGNWLSSDHPDWSGYLPLADPAKGPGDAQGGKIEAIFRLSSNGLTTQRDEWVWDYNKPSLVNKVKGLISGYEAARRKQDHRISMGIKWDRELDRYRESNIAKTFDSTLIRRAFHRPFLRSWLYFDLHFNAMTYRLPSLYARDESNPTIAFRGVASQDRFTPFAVDAIFDAGLVKTGNGRTFGVTRFRYISSGERVDNITDWALKQFRARYADPAISKDDIFAYCYAALHDPVFRETHAADLRREFPRIPLNDDFAQWRDWGEALLKLHIDYEKAKPFKLTRRDTPIKKEPVPKLRSLPEEGTVVVDSEAQLTGIPREAWNYRLGNRSAIDWVLDQHKEKTPRDPTVRAKFNTYRFVDHKEEMIKLLAKVVTVSLETVKITEAMRSLARQES